MNGVLVGDTSLANIKAEIAWNRRSSSRPVELSLTVNVAVLPAANENGAWPSLTDPLVRWLAPTAMTFLPCRISLVVRKIVPEQPRPSALEQLSFTAMPVGLTLRLM